LGVRGVVLVADNALKTKKYDLCIVGGCGHVGLPLGMAFANEGKKIALYDLNKTSINKVNKAEMPFMEEGAEPVLKKVVKNGNLMATNDAKVISFLGRINKLKGLKSLVDAFNIVHKKIPKSYLVIAGSDDGYLSELKKLISGYDLEPFVIFPGTTFGELKNALYHESDVFVYPSPAEGFSIAILEAAASGLPLVITPGCKFPDVVTYDAGYIADDVGDMAEKILKILLSNKLRKKLAENAQNLIKSKYSIEAMSSKLIKLYNSV
jgi:glycosyltransferase involved in cell wall biosynthesis